MSAVCFVFGGVDSILFVKHFYKRMSVNLVFFLQLFAVRKEGPAHQRVVEGYGYVGVGDPVYQD